MRTFSFAAAKQFVKDSLEDYLQQRHGINTRRAFRCLNPAHEDRHPSMGINRNAAGGARAHCQSCGANYDTFGVIAIDYNLTNDKDIFAKAYELFDIQIEGRQTSPMCCAPKQVIDKLRQEAGKAAAAPDFTTAADHAAAALLNNDKALDYLQTKRGLSRDIIEDYKIGFCAGGYNSFLTGFEDYQTKSKKASLYRLFFPFWNDDGKCDYFLAEINDREQVDDFNPKYRNLKGLSIPIFNARRLVSPGAVFICEAVYDALSIETAGGAAVAILGANNQGRLLDKVKTSPGDCVFIICLDNDKPGQDAAAKMSAALEDIGAAYLIAQLPEGIKDANEYLTRDRAAFAQFVEDYKQKADDIKNKDKNEYLSTSAEKSFAEFFNNLSSAREPVSTGLKPLDDILDGGLFPGLYVIGAVSSLGKTTLALQIADNIASSGGDVLIFSLEQGKNELFAKSLSRITYQETPFHAKTARDFLRAAVFNENESNNNSIFNALNVYKSYCQHIYIHEGVGLVGVNKIRAEVAKHVKFTERRPLVVVDYLQILAPMGEYVSTDKQNIDRNITELKRLSRDYDLTVLAISSFNRESYSAPVNMGSFKESGAIEYSSDVLIGLQFEGMDFKPGELDRDRAQRTRDELCKQLAAGRAGNNQRLEVKILKNRNGAKNSAVLEFCPKYNCFSAAGAAGEAEYEGEVKI